MRVGWGGENLFLVIYTLVIQQERISRHKTKNGRVSQVYLRKGFSLSSGVRSLSCAKETRNRKASVGSGSCNPLAISRITSTGVYDLILKKSPIYYPIFSPLWASSSRIKMDKAMSRAVRLVVSQLGKQCI
jgi:hypothetical protein